MKLRQGTRCAKLRELLSGGPRDLLEIAAAIGTDTRFANAFLQHLRRRGEAHCIRRGDQGRFRARPAVWAATAGDGSNAEWSGGKQPSQWNG